MAFYLNPDQLVSLLSTGYIKFVLIVVLWLVVTRILVFVIKKYLMKIAEKTKTEADDIIIKKTASPISWLVFFIGVQASAGIMPLSAAGIELVRNVIKSIIIILVMFIVVKIINITIDLWGKRLVSKTKSTADDALLGIAHRIINILAVALTALMVFEMWGVKVGPLIASLGIAGLAVAFALQSTLGNIFGGVSMIIDKTYRVGDWVDIGGVNGRIHDIGIRSTKVRTWDNEIVAIPNGKAADSIVKNYTLPNKRIRINVEFGVEYGSDIEKVQKIVIDILKKKIKNIMGDPGPYVLFRKMNDSSLDFVARFWIPDLGEKLTTQQLALTEIYKALNKNKVGIPFPQMDVHLKK